MFCEKSFSHTTPQPATIASHFLWRRSWRLSSALWHLVTSSTDSIGCASGCCCCLACRAKTEMSIPASPSSVSADARLEAVGEAIFCFGFGRMRPSACAALEMEDVWLSGSTSGLVFQDLTPAWVRLKASWKIPEGSVSDRSRLVSSPRSLAMAVGLFSQSRTAAKVSLSDHGEDGEASLPPSRALEVESLLPERLQMPNPNPSWSA
mmetsp:Transcript_58114/g.136042  ORF Transcript_58114/g.136042 Transcript_58114/m.136042 type:complete len:207 (+) Transcript_58114:205-825(+)